MCSLSNGKNIISSLAANWREMIATQAVSSEIAYRIDKLVLRLDVIADKIFVKTVKAHEMLLECSQLTEQFKTALKPRGQQAFWLLSRLEDRIDDLVKQTHEFRIKAG